MFNNWRASQVVLVGLIIIIVISGGAWRTEESSAGSVRQSAGAATRNPLCKCPGWDSWRRSIAVLSHSPCSFIYPSCHLSIYPSLHHGVILCCHHPSRRFHYGPSFIPHLSLLVFHHVPSIDLGVPSCPKWLTVMFHHVLAIHWLWCSSRPRQTLRRAWTRFLTAIVSLCNRSWRRSSRRWGGLMTLSIMSRS